MPSDLEELVRPLTPVEMAELSNACQEVLTKSGQMLLRRALFQLEASHRERDALRETRSELNLRINRALAALAKGGVEFE